jgi:phage replication initiation protein
MENSTTTMAAFIDTLTFTLPADSSVTSYSVDDDFTTELTIAALDAFLRPFGLQVGTYCGGGKNFYRRAYWLEYCRDNDVIPELPALSALGFVAVGGNSDTACVYLTGFACSFLNMSSLMSTLRKQLESYNARITRCDTALDCLNGEYTVDDAVEWWNTDRFTTKGGKPTKYTCHGGWLPGQESERTFEVGSRQSTKFTRIYEKGAQLGDPDSPWVRFEIEWKSSNGAVIPYDILDNPGAYLRDAYDCFSWIPTDREPSDAVKYAKRSELKIDVDHFKKHCRTQYGKLISTLLALGIPADHVLADLSRSGIPARLIVPPVLSLDERRDTPPPF